MGPRERRRTDEGKKITIRRQTEEGIRYDEKLKRTKNQGNGGTKCIRTGGRGNEDSGKTEGLECNREEGEKREVGTSLSLKRVSAVVYLFPATAQI